ncbi:MAG: hypothetical protein FWF38_02325 [Spirochaetaceae bacterium]|nr:hypothetical protein [Spirochaetaceae bacterium]
MKKVTIFFVCFIMMHISLYANDYMKVKVENTEIDVPLGWYAQYTKSPQIFFLYSPLEEGDDFQENCNLMKEMLPGKYSLKDYMEASIEVVKEIYIGLVLEETGTNYYVFSGIVNNIRVKQIQYYYIKNNIAYILTFSATPDSFSQYSAIFKKIAESFKIL